MRFILLILFLILNLTKGYSITCSGVVDCLRKRELKKIKLKDSHISKYDKLMIEWQVNFLTDFDISQSNFAFFRKHKPLKINLGSVYYYINKGDYFFHKFIDKKIEALENYKIALEQSKLLKDERLKCEVLKKILSLHRLNYLYDNRTYENYLESYRAAAYDNFELANYHYFNLILNFKNYYLDKWDKDSYNWLIKYFETNEYPYLKAICYNVFASYYEEKGNIKRVKYYISQAEKEFSKIPYGYKKIRVNQLLMFAARIAAKERDISKLENYLKLFDTTTRNRSNSQFKSLYFYYHSVLDTMKGNYESAYKKYFRYEQSQDSLRKYKYNDLLNELETKYETAEKEKQILEEQQKVRTNRNWLIAAGLALVFGAGIAILLQKNTTKKRKLAEQEALLEQQKVETLLKEQELTSIDAMIAGQEKERQKVANELHDDLGSLMATVKLHFDNVKVDEKDPAMKNAQALLEKAYQKIRGMAHSKNSGVMANQGLLPAIEKMAKTINETNALELTVEDFGLGERMENSLELTIFRILQELAANIIKHSQATKASIQLTQHEDNMNIIVEDNGRGFDMSVVKRNDNGMGLGSIERRIEHLEGTFTVDSIEGKGTAILIDIPI